MPPASSRVEYQYHSISFAVISAVCIGSFSLLKYTSVTFSIVKDTPFVSCAKRRMLHTYGFSSFSLSVSISGLSAVVSSMCACPSTGCASGCWNQSHEYFSLCGTGVSCAVSGFAPAWRLL